MAVTEKPDLDEALLIHYGIKGMKWGVRSGSKTTGVSRARGAAIDRNNRIIARTKEAQAGKGRLRDRLAVGIDNKLLGQRAAQNYRNYRIKDMQDQNKRLRTGKTTVSDKLQVLFTTTPLDLVVSVKPK